MQYKLIVTGGTFDLFHNGHVAFLKFQLKISEKLLLGITSDKYLQKVPKLHEIELYVQRKKSVEDFLVSENALKRVKIVPIDSIDPEDSMDSKIQAIVITPETEKGAILINKKRHKKGLPELKVIKFKLQTARDGLPISSTRIRNGEINRQGEMSIDPSWKKKSLFLPPLLRQSLKQPFGQIITNNTYPFKKLDKEKIVTVGDITTKTFVERRIIPQVAIIDLVVEREKKFTSVKEIGFKTTKNLNFVKNPAGQITPLLWSSIQKAFYTRLPSIIQIDGEEDLAVLPSILILPLGWKVFYGQPGIGMVIVEVSEETKKKTKLLLKNFTLRE